MLISVLAAVVLATPVQPTQSTLPQSAATACEGHGKLNWFEGSYEEALALAASSKKIIFIDLWTDW